MQHPRRGSNEIDKPRRRSGSAVPSISNSLKPPSSIMRRHFRACSRATDLQQMSVSCCGTRTRSWNAYYSRKVNLNSTTCELNMLTFAGIDVQAELSSKTESPHLAPTKAVQQVGNQPSPVQRAIMNRHHQARRSLSGMGPKVVSSYAAAQSRQEGPFPRHSPQLQPTPPSHTSSPIATKSPGFVIQEGMNSPASDVQSQHHVQPQQQQQQKPQPPQQQQRPHLPPRSTSQSHARAYPGIAIPTSDTATHLMTPSTAGENRSGGETDKSLPQSGYYPSHFQNHINQLGKLSRPLLSIFL